VRVAHQAGAKRLALFHHDPLRDDEALDELAREMKELATVLGVEVMVASEGLTVSL
jgi:phosphoribosyl 1,2-cyclic phosphodiesterase